VKSLLKIASLLLVIYNWTPLFEVGYFKFPVISNSKPFPMDLLFSHLLSAFLNSCYFKLFFVFSLKVQNSMVPLYFLYHVFFLLGYNYIHSITCSDVMFPCFQNGLIITVPG